MADTSNKRSPIQIEFDRKEIARRYLQGETQAAIAESMNLTQQMVSYDLARIKEAWLESSLVDFNEVRARELARIDTLEQEYWQAWRASMADRTRDRREEKLAGLRMIDDEDSEIDDARTIPVEIKTSHSVEQRDGNPAFLAGIQSCIEQRCKIFGLYSPERFALVDWRKEIEEHGISAGDAYERMVNSFLAAIPTGDGADDRRSVARGETQDQNP